MELTNNEKHLLCLKASLVGTDSLLAKDKLISFVEKLLDERVFLYNLRVTQELNRFIESYDCTSDYYIDLDSLEKWKLEVLVKDKTFL